MKVENTDVEGLNPRPDSAEDRLSVDIKSESDDTTTVCLKYKGLKIIFKLSQFKKKKFCIAVTLVKEVISMKYFMIFKTF